MSGARGLLRILFRTPRRAALLAGLVGTLVFLNSLGNGFAYDDHHIILENEAIHSLETLPEALLLPYWPGKYGQGLGLWRPVVTGLYGLEWAAWGESPMGYHAVNVLLHGVVTALVVLLLAELLPLAGAFTGGMVFAVHPIHVEAVANVVGRAEILAALFFLWACLLILRGGGEMGLRRYLAVLLLFALGFLTKESAITLPGVVLLLDASRSRLGLEELPSYLRRRWPLYAGLVAVAGGILLARQAVLGTVAKPFAPMGAHILEEIPRIWTVAASWPHVVRLLVFPANLSADYGPDVIPIAFGWDVTSVLGLLLVLGFLLLALVSWRSGPLGPGVLGDRAVGWGVVWMVITLSPTSNLLFLSGILLSERTLYLPSVGLAMAAGWGILRLHRPRPAVAGLLLAAVVVLMTLKSWTRTPDWRDNVAVFTTLVEEHPESGRAQWVIADSYLEEGNLRAALRAYRTAVVTLDNHYDLLTETGARLMGGEHAGLAEFLLRRAWEERPDLSRAPGLLATLYARQGRYEESEKAALGSLAADSSQVVQYHLLARALRNQDRYTEAIRARMAVIGLGEGHRWQQWRWLAELQVEKGDTAAALASLDSARVRAPSLMETTRIDSIISGLGRERGGGETLVPPPESAIDSQNPRPGGEESPSGG